MSILIKGIDMPKKHHMDGYYINDDGRVLDIGRRNVIGKAVQYDESEQQWIPCSERLPEESGRYYVTRGLNACGALWNRVYILNYSDLMGLKKEMIWWDGNVGKFDFERYDDVIAWMPLPEPYAGTHEK